MVLLTSPKQVKLQSCACARIEALEEENRWEYQDNAGDLSARGETHQTRLVMVVTKFAVFSQIGVMVLLLSRQRIELGSSA